ncbi:UDP-N-acetylmuramate dehydrogenase [Parasalinivibrio latis]|uniref:UDP-N-acetylmuramate dehydrogenase n=1 Tax=Parasalinivibrio latis TaxID=2952610 RepID=UPI0030E3AC43
MITLTDNSLASHHTFGIAVNAKHIICAESAEELVSIWQSSQYASLPKLILGEGSNMLFCSDYPGLVVLNRIRGIEVEERTDDWLVHAGAGENWHEFVRWTLEQGMPGLENLALIPGCVGSSPIQNIGAYGAEIKEFCEYVDVLNIASGEVQRLPAEACRFGYRDSVFKHELKDGYIITAVGFRISKLWLPKLGYGALSALDDNATPMDVFNAVCDIRRSKLPDPARLGNAGSFFKNPVIGRELAECLLVEYPGMPCYSVGEGSCKLAAGWLIDQAGLKGMTVGGAKVHEQQALVLVNTGNATSADVLRLALKVVESVAQRFGVQLEHEVRFMDMAEETTLPELVEKGKVCL